MYLRSETIAAVATGLTDSGISIIRVSGPESFMPTCRKLINFEQI